MQDQPEKYVGGVAPWCGSILKSWSKDQTTVALSSGEAEYYALARGMQEGIGLVSLAKDMGLTLRLIVKVDSSAARAVANRIGLGRIRHMEVMYFLVQEMVQKRRANVRKVPGLTNPADIATKPKAWNEVAKLLAGLGVR